MFSRIIDFIANVYAFPVRTWKGGCSDGSQPLAGGYFGPYCETGFHQEPDKVIGAVSGLLIYGITGLVAGLILMWALNEISWRRNRQVCQHCGDWTLDISDGSEPGCISGQACCEDCVELHIDASVERRAAQEARVQCSHCSHEMDKVVEHRIIMDICGNCGAVFLGPDELEHLEELATQRGYDNGYDDARSSGSGSSMAMGFVIGSAVG